MSAALIEAARDALEAWDSLPRKTYSLSTSVSEWLEYRMAPTIARLRAALAAAERPYTDSTPHLNVGNSSFEHWFQAQPFATQPGIKQVSRDSYAAGMGDPLVVAAAEQPAEPVAWRLDYPPEADVGLPRFYGADDEARMRNHLECVRATVTPLYASPAAPAQAPLTDEQLSALILATVYDGDERIPYRDYWTRDIGEPFARAIERAHGIGSKA